MDLPIINDGNQAETSKIFTEIYNLSNRKLNVLMMGLKYTPTPEKNNPYELNDDVNEFLRKIRFWEYFHDEENNDESLVKKKSNFTPPIGRNESLDMYATATKTSCAIASKENNKLSIPLQKC